LRLLKPHDTRCVGPTSAFSRTSLRAPAPRGFPMRRECLRTLARFGEIACITTVRFASVGRTSCWDHRGGRSLFPSRCVRTEPLASLSRPSCLCPRSRVCTRMRVAKTAAKHARVNDACWRAARDAFHRARTFAPQRSFERPAPDFPGVVAWPPQPQFSPPFHPRGILSNPTRVTGPRPRAPCHREIALL